MTGDGSQGGGPCQSERFEGTGQDGRLTLEVFSPQQDQFAAEWGFAAALGGLELFQRKANADGE
jgi:hypothetical protein